MPEWRGGWRGANFTIFKIEKESLRSFENRLESFRNLAMLKSSKESWKVPEERGKR